MAPSAPLARTPTIYMHYSSAPSCTLCLACEHTAPRAIGRLFWFFAIFSLEKREVAADAVWSHFFSLRCSRGMIYELERRERSFSLANASRKIYVIDLESPTPTYFCISRCIPLSFAQEVRCLTLRVAKSSSLSRGDFIISKINLVLNLAA